ncbi:helix-turn-helix domain-containing protein, partial [Acinetobacter baumannii]
MDCVVPISDSDVSAQQIDTKERRKQLRIGRRRSEILDAAKQVFLAHDFAAVTIDEIAEAAGFSRAT